MIQNKNAIEVSNSITYILYLHVMMFFYVHIMYDTLYSIYILLHTLINIVIVIENICIRSIYIFIYKYIYINILNETYIW